MRIMDEMANQSLLSLSLLSLGAAFPAEVSVICDLGFSGVLYVIEIGGMWRHIKVIADIGSQFSCSS